MRFISQRKLIGALSLFVLSAASSYATLMPSVYGTSAQGELTGSRSGSSVVDHEDYEGGFSLSWIISNSGNGIWHYSYTAHGSEDTDLDYLIINLSNSCISPGDKLCVTNGTHSPELGTFSPGYNNPGLPNAITGVKFDTDDDLPQTFSFNSDRSPVYGDFYARTEDGYAYNSGNANHRSSHIADFIARPDGTAGDTSHAPEPGSFMMLGIGVTLLGIGRLRKLLGAGSNGAKV